MQLSIQAFCEQSQSQTLVPDRATGAGDDVCESIGLDALAHVAGKVDADLAVDRL